MGAGFGVLTLGLWFWEHDAHLRQAYELGQLKKQTAADVSALQTKAEAAVREANQQRAQAVRELEAREAKFAQEAQELRQRVATLQEEEQARLERVAALPAPELVTRVSTRLGLPQADQESGQPGSPSAALPTTLLLGEEGLRKVDRALVELDSCQEQGAALNEQMANLNDQLQTSAALAGQQAAAIEKLNQALQAKDRVLAESEAEHRAELKAARGTRLGRLKRAVEHVALGVVIGLVLR